MLKFEFEGTEYAYNQGKMSFRHALKIQEFTGMSVSDWQDSVDFKANGQGEIINPGPEWITSIAALYWLVRAVNGTEFELDDPEFLDFDYLGFFTVFMTASIAHVEHLLAEAERKAPKSSRPRGQRAAGTASRTSATRRTTTPKPLVQGEVLDGTGS